MTSGWRDDYRGSAARTAADGGGTRLPARVDRSGGGAFAGSVDVDRISREPSERPAAPSAAPSGALRAANAVNAMNAVHAMNAVNAMNAVSAINAMNAVNAVNAVNALQTVEPTRPGPRAGRPAGPVRLLQVAGCLVAEAGRTDVRRAAAIARRLPTESHRLTVVMAAPLPTIAPELTEQLQPWVWAGWRSVRLVGARAGAPDGDIPAAQELAEQLGVEVVAPDGGLMAVPDGSLFVVGGQASPDGRGAWWKFNPGHAPERVGSRYPPTAWEADLADFTDPGFADVVVDEVPAGLWIRRRGSVPRTDLAFAVSPDPRTVKVLVSRPGDEPLRAAQVRHAVLALPSRVRERMVVVAYGDKPLADDRLGAAVSGATRHTVRLATSLTLPMSRGRTQAVAVDEYGAPAWRPFVRELAWSPRGGPPRALKWSDPFGNLRAVGPAQYELNRQWVVELVECGLWVRPADGFGNADLVRELPLDGRQCTVVVTPPERRWLRPPWRAVARLMRRLPSDARSRVALAVPEDAGEAVAVAAARACAGVLDGRPVQLLGHDGNLEPRFVAMPVNRLQELLRWPSAVLRIVEQPPDTYAVGYTTRRAVGAGADEYAVAQPGAPAHTGEYSREYSPAYALDRALDRAPDRALDRALDRAPDRAPERLPEYVQHHVPSYVSEPVVEQPASTRELPVVGMRSYVDQLRRVPEPVWQSGPGRATGPVYDVTSRTGALPAPDPRPTSAPAWDTGGQQGGGEPQPRPALWEPGVVPEWDEVLRRQSRTDLRRPDLEEVRRSVSPYERYGRTTPEAAELVAARPGGRHRADPGVDERPVEDEPDPVRTDRDWRWPERR